jgi:hypothetical protein
MRASTGSELRALFVARSDGSLLGPATCWASGLWPSPSNSNRRLRGNAFGCRAGAHALEQAGGLKKRAAPARTEAAPGRCSATHKHTQSAGQAGLQMRAQHRAEAYAARLHACEPILLCMRAHTAVHESPCLLCSVHEETG